MKDVLSANSVDTRSGCFELIKPATVEPSARSSCTLLARVTSSRTSNPSVASCSCHITVTLALPAATPTRGVKPNSPLFNVQSLARDDTPHASGFPSRASTVRFKIIDATVRPSPTANVKSNLLFARKDSFTRWKIAGFLLRPSPLPRGSR